MVRAGRGGDMIDSATRDGRWHRGNTADDVREQLLRDWHADRGVLSAYKLLIATTVAEVEQLNTAARAMVAADRKLGDSAITVLDVALADAEEHLGGDRCRVAVDGVGPDPLPGERQQLVVVDPAAVPRPRERDGSTRSTRAVCVARRRAVAWLVSSRWAVPAPRASPVEPTRTSPAAPARSRARPAIGCIARAESPVAARLRAFGSPAIDPRVVAG
jgi:hypothetical protein